MSIRRFFVAIVCLSLLAIPSMTGVNAQDSAFKEAPMLAAKVAAGELPPVNERLPENPMVVEPVDSIGVYGGVWHRAWRGVNDFHAFGRIIYDPVLRWPRDPNDPVQPSMAEKWEWSADGKELTLYFRKGLKWSDGAPFTVDDVIFWWEAIETDTNITKSIHGEWQVGGEPMKLEKKDDVTITLKFAAPNGLAETVGLAFHGNQWPLGFERFGFYAPKHYLEQYHPKYNASADYKIFEEKAFDYNVERPVMTAWKISQYEAGTTLMVAERNPYYWRVDKEGNQLPYIDYVYFHFVEATEGVNAMGIAGDLSMQARAIDLAQYPVYIANQEKGNYHMLLWPQAQASSATLWFNQSYPDDNYRTLFQDLRFRKAMSHAIDRETINQVAFLGQGVARTSVVVPDSPCYTPEEENVNGEFDPELAKKLLDEIGLKKGDDGFYAFADGSPILLVIETSITATGMKDSLEMISQWWSEVGIKNEVKVSSRDVFWPRAGANEAMVTTWTTDRGLVPMVDPIYVFPFDERSWMAPAMGIWYKTGGKEGIEPTADFKKAMDLYDEYKLTVDPARQNEICKEIVSMSTTNLWTLGTVGLTPNPVVVKNNFMNVAEKHTADWIIMTPGTLDPAHFYFSDGDANK
ncbi:MAG: ABC transporter substrate-binding protein [Anaerolineae bacterium]|nr:ABC transporter substrate-binding protein [Anaerolineae bacterium]CAG1015478.1 Periplasmic alpha-galactoside-binding protein [Anaerolineae bacterium]